MEPLRLSERPFRLAFTGRVFVGGDSGADAAHAQSNGYGEVPPLSRAVGMMVMIDIQALLQPSQPVGKPLPVSG